MTLKTKNILVFSLLVSLLPAGLVSCRGLAPEDVPGEKPEIKEVTTVPVRLSLHVGNSQSATKADVEVITEMRNSDQQEPKQQNFRGIDQVRIIPFETTQEVGDNDESLFAPMALGDIPKTLVPKANAYLYSSVDLPLGTSSALVYGTGHREDGTSYTVKHKYGSLIPTGFERKILSPSDLGFSPETILPAPSANQDATPEQATVIADVLTQIMFGVANTENPHLGTDHYEVTAFYGEGKSKTLIFYWDESIGNANLKDCYVNMKAGGALMPGSGKNVEAMLSSIYSAVKKTIINSDPYEIEEGGVLYEEVYKESSHSHLLTYGDIYQGVQGMILSRFASCNKITVDSQANQWAVRFSEDTAPGVADYPENLGLPSGAAVVRWTKSGYKVPLENGLDGIAPISRYCYPPSLYYYVNTPIRTAFSKSDVYPDVSEVYTPENTLLWGDILTEYYTSGKTVSTSTGDVALYNPLQFAVGMLIATVKADTGGTGYLQDNDGQDGTVFWLKDKNTQKDVLKLTGIIIGRQYPQHYDFTPVYHDADPVNHVEESPQYYLYDDQFPKDDAAICLTETESDEFRSLALETPANKEVYFCLEFLNDSKDQSFYGAEGRILPGHKFYLVGKLAFPQDASKDKVFMQDCYTKAPCVIKTLAEAHCAVPDLGIPTLALGVETNMYWELTTPTTVMMQ